MKNVEVNDLRSAIELLESIPGQLVETNVEVDPNAELSGVYRHVGAGGTVERPTQEGPAMIFNSDQARNTFPWQVFLQRQVSLQWLTRHFRANA